MKKIILIVTIICLISIEYTRAGNNYQTQCVSVQNDGYITIKIWNTKCGRSYKDISARKDAIHAILYSGIAEGNGCLTQYPVLNTKEEMDRFKKIEDEFFSKKGKWQIFIRSSTLENAQPITMKHNKWRAYEVSVSKNELRKYLEEQKIVESLNNGF